jgi:MFS family permease
MQTAEEPAGSSASRPPMRPLIPLYLGEFFLFVANSIAFTAIATRAVAAGLDSAIVGTAGSAYYAGLFAIFLSGPAIVRRVGLRRMLLAAAPLTLAGLAVLAFPTAPAWLVGRFTMGVGTAVLVVAIENWITLSIGREGRGRALAIYMAVYLASYVAGQSALLVVTPTSVAALWIAAASLLAGFAAFTAAFPPARPPPAERHRGGAGLILRHAPLGVAATLVSGLAAGAFYALGPVYALRIGMDPDRVPGFMILVVAGASVAQVALGVASDRVDRARLLVGIQAAAGAASLGLFLADEITGLVLALAVLWGSSAPLGYATAAAMVYDAGHGRPPREVAQVVLVANGIGGLLGPTLAAMLDVAEPGKGLFMLSIAVFAVLGGAGLWSNARSARRRSRSPAP